MEKILEKGKITSQIIGEQAIDYSLTYRPFFYLKTVKVNGGFLIHNLVTGDLYLLNEEEYALFNSTSPDIKDLRLELAKQWFLVPQDFDDSKFSYQIKDLILLFNKMRFDIPIVSYVILPTTDCNARCFYCFELGGRRRSMSKQTALDTVDYIVKKSQGRQISLRWFGGEPLYNSQAIDIISQGLKDRNIKFSASMVTNGYLFDDETVQKAVDLWNLQKVQITMDGTEEIYNRIKAYIYKEGNPFKRVDSNIGRLLNAGIQVNLRMNMDDHNVSDLIELTKYLNSKYSHSRLFNMYSSLLFEDSCDRIANRAANDRHKLIAAQMELQKHISSNGTRSYARLRSANAISHCMADSSSSIMILPDGELGKCEHYTDDHFIGSIYSDKINYEILDWFKTTRMVEERCEKCELRPSCYFPVCCMSKPSRCDDFDKQYKIHDLDHRIITMYEMYLKQHGGK